VSSSTGERGEHPERIYHPLSLGTLLGLVTYFTGGPEECRAWTIHAGTHAPQAAGVIHSDFERGFIKADVVRYDDLVALGSEAAARPRAIAP
jgi:hypothetical protein